MRMTGCIFMVFLHTTATLGKSISDMHQINTCVIKFHLSLMNHRKMINLHID